ncbi:MAG: hypothetical protein KC912_05970 [Proteobacteria bacterium]|nr:hypothetical protein [Pseudomonadota bacterium]
MRTAVLVALVFTFGCTDGSTTPADTSDTNACPDGMVEPRSARVMATTYIQNGVTLFVGYDETTTLADGQPSACVSTDGLLAQWVLSVSDGPVAVFRQSITAFGPQSLDATGGSATLEVIGTETVDANEWSTGTWLVEQRTDGTVVSTINANATTSDGGSYSLIAGFEATP